jgi:hypothetical protein
VTHVDAASPLEHQQCTVGREISEFAAEHSARGAGFTDEVREVQNRGHRQSNTVVESSYGRGYCSDVAEMILSRRYTIQEGEVSWGETTCEPVLAPST